MAMPVISRGSHLRSPLTGLRDPFITGQLLEALSLRFGAASYIDGQSITILILAGSIMWIAMLLVLRLGS